MKRLPPIIIILLILLSACSNTVLDESKQPEASPIPSESILPTEDRRLEQIEIASAVDTNRSQVIFTIANKSDSTFWGKVSFEMKSETYDVVGRGKIAVEALDSGKPTTIRIDVSTVEELIIDAKFTEHAFAELTTDAT